MRVHLNYGRGQRAVDLPDDLDVTVIAKQAMPLLADPAPETVVLPRLPVVSRLLGHRRPSMTVRYAHVGDRETEAAAERIGMAIAGALDGGAANEND